MISRFNNDPRLIMRQDIPLYNALSLHDISKTHEELVNALLKHPSLLRRPLVDFEPEGKTIVAEPPEKIMEVLTYESETSAKEEEYEEIEGKIEEEWKSYAEAEGLDLSRDNLEEQQAHFNTIVEEMEKMNPVDAMNYLRESIQQKLGQEQTDEEITEKSTAPTPRVINLDAESKRKRPITQKKPRKKRSL